MYAFAQRADTRVYDEPLYAHYLTSAMPEAEHPAAEGILRTQPHDGEEVVRTLILGEHDRPVVVFKQMTHHFVDLDPSFLQHTDNVILIRDPRAIIASYAKVIPDPTIEGIGVKQQLELYRQLKSFGTLRAILEARELLLNPERVLSILCERLGLEFDPAMLHWEAGPRPEDGVWAPHWYANVHRSTGFQPYVEKEIVLTPTQEELAEACIPYYDQLFQEAIKAN